MKTRGLCLIFSAPSGGGKTTFIREMLRRFPNLRHSISYTTRVSRKNTPDIKDYHFISKAKFEEMQQDGEFVESAVVHGCNYGTRSSDLESLLSEGFDVILDIDIQGAQILRSEYPEGVQIFILPPSLDILEQRLFRRASESKEELRNRLKNAVKEIQAVAKYDYVIINDNLELALKKIESIIIAEHCKVGRIDYRKKFKELE